MGLIATIKGEYPKLYGLKPDLVYMTRFLAGGKLQKKDPKEKNAIRRKSKRFLFWNDTLFRREKDELGVALPIGQLAEILTTFHDPIGHLDANSTKKNT